MVLGYVILGSFTGLLTFVSALFWGVSFWDAIGLYVLVGSTVVLLLPILVFIRFPEGWTDDTNMAKYQDMSGITFRPEVVPGK